MAAIVMCAGPAGASASQTGDPVGNLVVGGFSPGTYDLVGQTFTVPAAPPTEKFLHSLAITQLTRPTSATNHISITAVDGSGFPTGPVLYTSPAISGPPNSAPVTVYPNLTLNLNQQYAFYTESLNGISFSGNSPGGYAGGQLIRRLAGDGTWNGIANDDIAFLADFNTGAMNTFTTISCPGPGKVGRPTACTATLKSGNGPEPTLTGKQISLSNLSPGGSFSPSCFVDAAGSCSFNFTPATAGGDTIFGQFVADGTHIGSSANTGLTVNPRSNSVQTAPGCSPLILRVGETATCSVTVNDTDLSTTRTTPSGATSWSSAGAGTFAGGGACGLAPQSLGVSKCAAIAYTPTAPGTHSITSAYAGDASHLASTTASAGAVTVLPAAAAGSDCSSALAKISSVKRKLKKAHGAKKKKLKKKLKRLRGDAAALGC